MADLQENSIQHWYTLPENRERYQQELKDLKVKSRSKSFEVKPASDGTTIFVVDTPEPPGYRLYLSTDSDYPTSPPSLLAEKQDKYVKAVSLTIQNWDRVNKTNYLAEVVDDVIGRTTRKRLALVISMLGGLVVVAAILLVALLAIGNDRVKNEADAATAQSNNETAVANEKRNLLTTATAEAIANITRGVTATPNPTLQVRLTINAQQAEDNVGKRLQTMTAGANNENSTITALVNANAAAKATATAQALERQERDATATAQVVEQEAAAASAASATAAAVNVPRPTNSRLPPTNTRPFQIVAATPGVPATTAPPVPSLAPTEPPIVVTIEPTLPPPTVAPTIAPPTATPVPPTTVPPPTATSKPAPTPTPPAQLVTLKPGS